MQGSPGARVGGARVSVRAAGRRPAPGGCNGRATPRVPLAPAAAGALPLHQIFKRFPTGPSWQAMNRDAGNGLTEQDRAAIGRAAETAYGALGPVMESSVAALVADMRQDGARVRLRRPKELRAWRKGTKYKTVQASWAAEQEGKGVQDAALVLRKVDAGDGERREGAEQRERGLDPVRREEPGREVHEEDGAEHDGREAQAGRAGQEAGDERESAAVRGARSG
ncbi:hypothetical protein tb265_42430 [Gemmatimonadetes bacterium T265]|nr:hypothetical protein tb265_42430 [Gemmatimonadetes bacterium T265]